MLAILGMVGLFSIAFVGGSLAEYFVHRLMHRSRFMAAAHRRHHVKNSTGGVLHEFIEHCRGLPPALVIAALLAWTLGIASGAALLAGAIAYGAFSAYAHQLQHENPMRCFWMRMPIHYVHHANDMWGHNFGVGTDLWDRLFGTYRKVQWPGEKEREAPRRGMLEIRWL